MYTENEWVIESVYSNLIQTTVYNNTAMKQKFKIQSTYFSVCDFSEKRDKGLFLCEIVQ